MIFSFSVFTCRRICTAGIKWAELLQTEGAAAMRTSCPHQPLTYAVRLPDEAQADALRLLDASQAVVNAALAILWPHLDEFGNDRVGPAWKQVGKYMSSPQYHGDRQWRCESEVVGRVLRAQAERKAESAGFTGQVIEVLVLQALSFQAQANPPQAMMVLTRAFELAEPQGYVRIFVDEGEPMLALLRQARSRGVVPDYLHKLLAAFGTTAQVSSSPLAAVLIDA